MERTHCNTTGRNVIGALFVSEHLNETENSHIVRISLGTVIGKRKGAILCKCTKLERFCFQTQSSVYSGLIATVITFDPVQLLRYVPQLPRWNEFATFVWRVKKILSTKWEI